MIDLHTHTTFSDGEYTPSQLIDLALKKDIEALAITDHDTIDGLAEAVIYAQKKKIIFIPGIEIKAQTYKGKMHILGLNIKYDDQSLKEKLAYLVEMRNKRNDEFIKYFQKIGFDISLEELTRLSGGNIIGKPHFAKLLVKKGYIKDNNTVYNKYFNQEPLNQVKEGIYEPKEVIEMIKKAQGIPVLAHPQQLKLDDFALEEKIKELVNYGLEGLECYHSEQTREEMQKYHLLAQKYRLLITKGSDYHGPHIKHSIELGTGKNGNIVTKEETLILRRLLFKSRKN